MSIKKIEKKSGVSYRVRLQDSRGRDYYKTFPKKSLAEQYQNSEKLKKLKGYVTIKDKERAKYTVKDLCESFIDFKFPRLREGTRMSYSQLINIQIIPKLGEIKLRNFTKKDLRTFENSLIKAGYSLNTSSNTVYLVSTLLNYATEELHWIESNKAKNYKALKPEGSISPVYWEKEEVLQFLESDVVKQNYYYDLYRFLLNTGCRIGEAGALRVQDLDFKRKRIYIGWTLAKNNWKDEDYKGIYFSLNRQKSSSDRFVPMNDASLSLLLNLAKGRKKSEFIFTNRLNEHRKLVVRDGNNNSSVISAPTINTQHFSNTRFKNLQKALNIEGDRKIGAHGLRHTFASHYVMNGGDIYTLSKILGHSSIKITEIYAHLSPSYIGDIGNYVNFD